MHQYILRRLLIAIPTLLLITLFLFLLFNLAPGNPLSVMVNPEQGGMSRSTYEIYRKKFGLDKPLMVRYVFWLKEVLQGNLGRRTVNFKPVTSDLLPRMKNTFLLAGAALTLGVLVGVSVGIISAIWKYTFVDQLTTVLAFTALSIPVFFNAFLLLYFFSYLIPIFPGSGTHSAAGGSYMIQYLKHLTLPALSLAAFEIATFARYARSGLLEVLSEDYIRTAASKGLPFMTVFLRHALRNAVTTVVTMLGFRLRTLIAGAVVIETVFNWPGMGSLFLQGLKANDYPLLMAYTLVFATAIILSNLLVDVSYALIDPRVTYD